MNPLSINPLSIRIPFDQSPNYTKGPTQKTGYVLHATMGKFIGAKETLKASIRKDAKGNDLGRASAHLLISQNDGEWVELVQPYDVAWHAGKISKPDKVGQAVLKTKPDGTFQNPNDYMLGIEVCCGYDVNKNGVFDNADLNMTNWQYDAVAQYIYRNYKVYGIPYDVLVGHTNLTDYKKDDMLRHREEIMKRVNALLNVVENPITLTGNEVSTIKKHITNKEINGLFQFIKTIIK